MIRRLFWGAACALLLSTGLSGVAQAQPEPAPTAPTVSGPVTGGNGVPLVFSGQPADELVGRETFDLASVGYTQEEFFLDGTASAYSPATGTMLTADGLWTVEATSQAPYTSRIVVNRPADDRHFNGTVIVEWLNVSGGADASPDWMQTHVELIRQGYAWVGVSAQAVGVAGLKGVPPQGDPARYTSLAHPGDSYSYDIYSQAGRAVRTQADQVLGGLQPDQLIAVGESQSAIRMVTYIDAVHPVADVYDAFLVHSRFGGSAPLAQPPLATVPAPTPTYIRDDLDTPVLAFNTETDIGSVAARQPDSDVYRLWEVAGTAHFDQYGLVTGATDTGRRETVAEWFDSMRNPTTEPGTGFECGSPINAGPQTFVLRAAVAHLDRWAAGGRPPPRAPRWETVGTAPVELALDDNGIVRGGIRTPAVDAPVARLSGFGQTGTSFCFLFGTTTPFTTEQLTQIHGSRGGFVWAWAWATLKATHAGFLVPDDARHILAVGARSDILR